MVVFWGVLGIVTFAYLTRQSDLPAAGRLRKTTLSCVRRIVPVRLGRIQRF